MRTFVINLPRSTERRAHMRRQLDGLEHEFVEAVDGTVVDIPDRPHWVRPGLAACAQSHLNTYRQIVAEGLPAALILEDDAILPPDLGELAAGLAKHMAGREVALLYYRSHNECPLAGWDAVDLPGGRRLLHPLDPSQPIATGAYAITRGACEALLEFPHHEPDAWGKFVAGGAVERLRVVHPRPIRARLDFASTIDYTGTKLNRLIPGPVRTWRRRDIERRMSRFPVRPDR